MTDPFENVKEYGYDVRNAMKAANDILDLYFHQQLVWYKDKDKSIRWRIISRDDPFWGQFHEWAGTKCDDNMWQCEEE